MTAENITSTNNVEVEGYLKSGLDFSHKTYDENFYKGVIAVPRKSGVEDEIPFIVSERLIESPETNQEYVEGVCIHIEGQFRSYNFTEDSKNRLKLNLFVQEMNVVAEEDYRPYNEISLHGFICKQPNYRETYNERKICDLLVAVNRPYGKADYIPCIAWSRNATYSSKLPVGQELIIEGRIQSRPYIKKFEDGTSVEKVAYEVSVTRLTPVAKEEEVTENVESVLQDENVSCDECNLN